MALLTASEFADACIIKRTSLASYENRGKIVATGSGKNKKFDTENPTNALFIRDKQAKKTSELEEAEIINRIKKYPAAPEKVEAKPDTTHTDAFNKILAEVDEAEKAVGKSRNGKPTPKYEDSVQLLKYLDTLKREKEIEQLTIKIQKQRGEVVPADLIQNVFTAHNQSILIEFKNGADDIIRIISAEKRFSVDEIAKIRGQLVDILNRAIDQAIENTAKSVEQIINDYTSILAVGERT
ncbi:MAG: hypothetical protein BGO31_00115 [Bacteroidetes bacterium 43-16]|uniref:hypothetical protein n=1 Tax=uncultured Dysgonomonas sp. TaxID=206096 RepID=UPI00092AD79D|nr:hypothetical protein [uncultured Dysgonomonas sp.]OJV51643.1 MAG: hypothetical protein BGO31_00115 [Bacteroidetes bacterium 43-16]